ncbi:MAG: hypothetical protein PHP50_04920 [Lachnospiraceae bacterium]|nr:hypothetical protein [Lachnospiraceae bacterium]
MYIAVCDDNVADRKHLERLLSRESDKRMTEKEHFNVDSFGNASVLLGTPDKYDLFFLDMTDSELNGYELAMKLIQSGSKAPIVLCSSIIIYENMPAHPQLRYLKKKITTSRLSDMLDQVTLEIVPHDHRIELRNDDDTLYVEADEILYIHQTDTDILSIALTEGRSFTLYDDIVNFYNQLNSHPAFFMPTGKLLLNASHVKNLAPLSITMTDQTRFHYNPIYYSKIQALLKNLMQ